MKARSCHYSEALIFLSSLPRFHQWGFWNSVSPALLAFIGILNQHSNGRRKERRGERGGRRKIMTGWVIQWRMGDMNRSGGCFKRVSHHSWTWRTKGSGGGGGSRGGQKRSCENSAPKCTGVKEPFGQHLSLKEEKEMREESENK